MITQDMPAVMDGGRSGTMTQPSELFPMGIWRLYGPTGNGTRHMNSGPTGDEPETSWSSDEDIRGDIPDNPAIYAVDRAEPAYSAQAPASNPAGVSIDSAQHLLQSISSDDDGSRSPSPVRRSPSAVDISRPLPANDPAGIDHADLSASDSSFPATMEDIYKCDESEIVSLVGNLCLHDRHPFINHAIRRFSHDVLLSLRRNAKFLSDIESWCCDAFHDQDFVFVEDILLLIELLPVFDVSSVSTLCQFLSDSRIFAETQFEPLVQRILARWGSLSPTKPDQVPSPAAKPVSSACPENASQPVKPPSTSAPSRQPNRLPPNPKSGCRNRRNAPYVQTSNSNRRPSPARLSPHHSVHRSDSALGRSAAPTRQQRSPRSPSPRAVSRSKTTVEIGMDRRPSNFGNFTRDSASTDRNVRPFESTGSYPSRSEYDFEASRSSAHQRPPQRERPPSSFKQDYRDRRMNEPHRFESIPESRSRNIDMLPSETSAPSNNRLSYSDRDHPTKYGMKRADSYSEKGYYSDSDNRFRNYSRSVPAPASSSSVGKRSHFDYDKPRESGPGSLRPGTQDSRSAKYSYEDSFPRSQRQFQSSSFNDRSVSPHAVRSRSPHSYRNDERSHHNDDRTHVQDDPRDFRRYHNESASKYSGSKDYQYATTTRGDKPLPRDDYRDFRRDDEKDLRPSSTKDYRRDLTRDLRQEESQSFKRNDVTRDFHQSNAKRKPDFRWSQDGPSKSMRLSDEERRELVQKGACLYCRKPGHTIENCRTRPARSS